MSELTLWTIGYDERRIAYSPPHPTASLATGRMLSPMLVHLPDRAGALHWVRLYEDELSPVTCRYVILQGRRVYLDRALASLVENVEQRNERRAAS